MSLIAVVFMPLAARRHDIDFTHEKSPSGASLRFITMKLCAASSVSCLPITSVRHGDAVGEPELTVTCEAILAAMLRAALAFIRRISQ